MSSCSTEKMSADVQEELAAASCTANIVLHLGAAGYTAPPPTPMASASSDYNLCAHHNLPYAAAHHEDHIESVDSTPTLAPTRADLDALAHYLMHQSLFSTPTLSLAASPTAHRKRRSLPCNPPPTAATSSIDVIGEQEGVNAPSIDAIAAPDGEQEVIMRRLSNDHYGITAQTYHYRPGEMSMGFCEEGRRAIQRACQEIGAFYITATVQEYVNFEQMNERSDASSLLHAALDHHFLQLQLAAGERSSSNMCVGSGPLLPLSELLISPDHQETSTISALQDDDTFQLLADLPLFLEDTQMFQSVIGTNFRETMTKYAKVLFEISKDLIKLLLEELCVEAEASIRGYSLKPLLYIGKHEKSNDVKHDIEDVVLSLSHGIHVNHQDNCNKSVSIQAIVGNQLQTWSKRKYKAPNLDSLCNVGSGEVCIKFVLIHHH